MLKKSLFFLCFVFYGFVTKAETVEDIIALSHKEHPTNCAEQIFSQALFKHSSEISESDPEFKVRAWAHESMTGDADILKELLNCPELKNVADTTTVVFSPIQYEFPGGRTLTINYSTQPKVLKQKIMLANKRSLPNGNMSPDLMNITDGSKYLNTEPAWYGILVVQHDSLKDFVGPDKNNTVSMKYINDHIGEIYPQGYYCTSKSAWANDKDTINQVVKDVVNVDGDSNDYYVAGDMNLEWVMYAEIAADIIITVVTAGTGQFATGALKGVRAAKTASQLAKNVGRLKKLPHVAKYAKSANQITSMSRRAEMLEKNIANAKKYEKALKNLENAKKANNATDIAKYQKETNEILQSAKKIDPGITDDLLKKPDQIQADAKKLKESIPDMEKDLAKSRKENYSKEQLQDIDNYLENYKYLDDLLQYRGNLNAARQPQTGNFITKNLKKLVSFGKSAKAANTGAKTMNKAAKVARAGMSSRSAKIGQYLFDATLKHGARLARFERDAGLIYGAVSFIGDMYDKTSTTSQEFSNGIEFKPLCLLSADDLEGQENVVNYGMWLMWVGDSVDQSNDDAAYLQAMDFASKFYYQLDEFQDEHGANCNIDIYVVRPFIKLDETNMDNPSGELFYLLMNDIPWSTAEQFDANVKNVDDWARVQKTLNEQDPQNKYKKPTNNDSEQITAQGMAALQDENMLE